MALCALTASAQTNFWWTNWQGAAQGYNWSTNVNWTNDSANGNAPLLGGATNYIVNFANGGGTYTVTNDLGANGYGFYLNQMVFSNDAVTLAGDNLIFSRGVLLPQVLQHGASNIAINTGLMLSNNLTWGGAGSGGITVNGSIWGAGGVTNNGTNYTLTLTGNNTYSGGTIINAGTVTVNNVTGTGLGSGAITLNGNSTLNYNTIYKSANQVTTIGGTVGSAAFNMTGGAFYTTNNMYVGNAANATGALFVTGGNFTNYGTANGAIGLLIANAANSTGLVVFAGNTTTGMVGLVKIGVGANASGALVISNGAYVLQSGDRVQLGATFGANGTLTVSDPTTVFDTGSIVAGMRVGEVVGGTGTVNLISGLIMNRSVGGLSIGGGNSPGGGVGFVNVYGGIFSNSGGGVSVGSVTNSQGTLTVTNGLFDNSGYTLTIGAATTTVGFVNLSGGTINARQLTLVGSATTNALATLQVSGGTLNIGSGGITAGSTTSSKSNIWLSGGNIGSLAAWNSSVSMTLTNSPGPGNVTFVNTNNVVLSGFLTGPGGLTMAGSGAVLTLSGTNLYTGATTLTAGELAIGSYTNLLLNNTINFNGGALQITGNTITNLGAWAGNWSSFNGGIDVSNAGFVVYLTNSLSGVGNLTKMGNGTLALSGTNTFSGLTTLNNGILILTNTTGQTAIGGNLSILRTNSPTGQQVQVWMGGVNELPGTSIVTLQQLTTNAGDVRLDLQGFSQTIGGLVGMQVGGGTTNLIVEAAIDSLTGKPATLTISNATGSSYAYQGYLRDGTGGSSALSIIKDGPGTQSLGGPLVAYTGPTTIRNGMLILSNTTAMAVSSLITNNAGLTFWTDIGSNMTNTSVLAGANGFTKAGAGNLTIGAANTFTNGITIAGGQLTIGNADGTFGAIPLVTPATNITFSGLGGIISDTNGITINTNRTIWLSGSSSTGTFDVASGKTMTINGQITGPGTLAKQGTGLLYLTNFATVINPGLTNFFTGGTVINAGTIKLGGATALGTPSAGSGLTIGTLVGQTLGGSLDLNGFRQDLLYTNTTLNSFGVSTTIGALQNSSGTDVATGGVRNVTLLGSSAIGQDNGKNFGIQGVVNGNGNYLAKIGNASAYTYSNVNNLAGLYVNSGTLGIQGLNPSNVPLIQVNNGAALQLYGRTLTNTTTVVLNGGTLSESGVNLIQGQVILQAATNGINNGSTYTIGGGVSGPGGLVKNGSSNLIITNASYSGVTLIDQGVVQFAGATAPATPGSITINDGGYAAYLRTGGLSYQGNVNNNMGILAYNLNGGAMAVNNVNSPYTTVTQWLNSGLLNPASGGALALMQSSSENINMNTGLVYTNLSLGAIGTISYTGTLTPYGTTYRIGGGGGTLIMVNTNALTGAGMSVNSGMGNGGTVILSASNDASGVATVVANSTLQIGNNQANGWLATPTIVDNGTLSFMRSDVITNTASITGLGGLTTIGKGALVINSVQAYAGATAVSSNSTLRLIGNGMLGANGLNAGDFNIGNTGGISATAIVDSATAGWTGMTFRVGNGGNGYLAFTNGVINALGGFVMGNAATTTTRVDMAGGTLNVNTFNNPGTINNFLIGNGTGTNTLFMNGGQINLNNGASMVLGNVAGSYGVVMQSNGIVNLANGSLILGNSTSSGQYYLVGGTLIASNITRNNGYGGLTFNGGKLQASGNNANWISNLSTAIVAVGGATIDSSIYNVTLSNNLIGSAGSMTKLGSGTLVLAGTNATFGGISINEGLVVYSASNAIGGTSAAIGITNNANGAVAFGFTNDISAVLATRVLATSAGAIALLDTNKNSSVSFASMPNAFLGAATNLTYGGNFTPNGTTYRLGGGGAVLTYTNVIGASGTNIIIGGYMPGSVVSLTANNLNDGAVTVSGGVLRAADGVGLSSANLVLNGGLFETTGTFGRALGTIANTIQVGSGTNGFSAYGAPATINLNGGGSLTWGDANFNPTALVLNGITANTNLTFANGLDFNGQDRTILVHATNANSTATISGALVNGGATAGLIKGGAGTLNLTTAGSYDGTTTINGGALQVSGADNVLPVGTTVTLANTSGAAFILSNQNQTVAGLTGGGVLGGNVQLIGAGKTLTVSTAGNDQYSGAMSGSGNLTMAGAGTLTLANNTNNLTGLTSINSGTLALTNASVAGPVNVAAGATLAVNGAIQQGLFGRYYNVASPNYAPLNSNSPAPLLTALAASNIAFTAASTIMGTIFDAGRDNGVGWGQGAFLGTPWATVARDVSVGGTRPNNQQAVWTGKYTAPSSGKYVFDSNGDDQSAVWVDGVLVVKHTANGYSNNPDYGSIYLSAGPHDIVIAYGNGSGNLGFFVDVAAPGGTTNRLLNSALTSGTLASIGSLSGDQGSTLAINNAYLTITQTVNGVFGGNITGLPGDTLTKMGSGTLTLSGTNTYGAGTIVAGGTLVISGTNAMPGTGLISVTTNGVVAVDYTGVQATLGNRIDSGLSGVLALTPTSANESLDFSAGGANMANAFLGAISNMNYTGVFTPYGSAVANTYVPYTINNYSMDSTNFYRLGGGGATLTNANALVNPYSLMLMANSSVALGSVATYNLAGGLNMSTNTLLDLKGTSLAGPISGVGTITNSSATSATLTVGQDNVAYTPGIVLGGNLNLTKNGSGIWTVTNNNSFTGAFTLNSGYFTNAAPSGTTPIGTGNVVLNGGTLVFAPQALTTNLLATYAAANATVGSTVTYGGISALVVNQGPWTNLTLTLGNSGAGANSVLNRNGYGALIIAANSGMTNLGLTEKVIVNGGVPVNNGMVAPYILGRNNDGNANLDFLTYDNTKGFITATYSDTNFFAANNTKIELFNPTVPYTNNSALTAVYAMKMTNSTLVLSNQMTIGNGAGQAGLILDGGTINGASNLLFGGAEAVIAVSKAGGTINAPITGTAGITVIANETLSSGTLVLGGTNTYTGGTRVEGARVSLSNARQLGYGDVWVYGDYQGGGQLFLTGTMNLTNNLHLSGIGAQTDTNPYGALRFGNGTSTNILLGTIELMGDTRVDFGNAAGVAIFSNQVYGTGRLMVGFNQAGQLSMTASNTYSGPTELGKGTLRATDGVGLPSSSLLILNGGTFETGVSFNRTLGFGPGQIRFQSATDGFSANTNLSGIAGPVVFSLNTPGSVVVWGTNNFNPSTLMLNDSFANTSLILSNSLDLNGGARTISVAALPTNLTSTIAHPIINSGTSVQLTKNGVGVLVLTGTNSGFGVTISGGILRADLGVGIPTNIAPLLLNGGVFETDGLINASLGQQPGQIQFNQGTLGGFSAYGAPVTVSLDRGTTLVWQANSYFNPSALSLQEVSANASLTFLNNIDLAGEARTITVNNINPTLAPVISGFISSAGTLWNSILTKNGAGTLVLTGTNTYGSTIVSAGILRADQGVGMATNGLITLAGGIWESAANITLGVGSNYTGNTIQLTAGNAGFNAVTNPITIDLSSGSPLVWGTNYFNPAQLVFNNNATPGQTNITFRGLIDINGGARSINVGTGTVTLAGGLYNSAPTNNNQFYATSGSLLKYGTGTLVVSNQGALVFNNATASGLNVHMGTLVLASGSMVGSPYMLANVSDIVGDVTNDVATLTLMNNSVFNRTNNTLIVGNNGGAKGTFNIQDNARFFNSYQSVIGNNAFSTGTVNITSGVWIQGSDMQLGKNAGAVGSFNVFGGAVSNQGGNVYIGNAGVGIMTVTNGVYYGPTDLVGNGAGGAGAVYQSGGLFDGHGELKLGVAAGAYGYYQLSGGVLSNNNWIGAARDNGLGLFYQSGGTNVVTASGLLAAGGSGTGVIYVTGGLMNLNNNQILIGNNAAANGRAEFTVADNALVITTNYITMGRNNLAGYSTNFINLDGGVLQVSGIFRGTNLGYQAVNFNGGTLRASANNAILLGPGGVNSTGQVDAAYVWNGGAFIDTATNTVTIGQSLITPAVGGGSGVVSIAFSGNIGGFIGAPYVAVSGNGIGATAVAQYDNAINSVTNIFITNPGVGYTATPTFTLIGGGSTNVPLPLVGYAVTMATNASGALTKSGSGMLILGGTNSYTGGTLINSGVVLFASAYAIPNQTPNSITINSGGALAVAGANSNVTDWLTSGYIVSGASGALALTSNSVSENINMALYPNLSLGAAIGSNVLYTGTLTPAGSTYYVGGGGGTIVFTNVNALTGGRNVVVGNGGGGTVVLSTNNNYTGGTLIYAGTLQLGNSNATAWFASSGNVTNNGTLVINNTDGLVLNQTISGSGILFKSGNGTTTLNAANSYSGGTIITNGAVLVQNTYGLGDKAGPVTVYGSGGSSNYSLQLAGNITVSNALTVIGTTAGRGRIQNISGSNTLQGAITIGNIQLNSISFDASAGFLTLAGDISGNGFTVRGAGGSGNVIGNVSLTGDLTQTDTGSRWLIGAAGHTYVWNNTAVSVGTMQMGLANILAPASTLTIGQGDNSTAIFDLNGYNQTVSNVVFNNFSGWGKFVTNSSATQATLTLSASSLSTTNSGSFAGNLALNIVGNGTVMLCGTNTHTGDTTMQGGTLVVSNQLALQNSTLNYLSGNVQFALGMGTNFFGGLAGSGNLALYNAGSGIVLTIGGNNSNETYSGNLTDLPYARGVLIKRGSGAQTLSGVNTFSGGLTVSNGTLNINSASAVGTGLLTLVGGTSLGNTSGNALTNVNDNAQRWLGDFTFAGTSDLHLGLGAVDQGAVTRTVTVSANNLTVGALTNTGGLTVQGAGQLTLGGVSTHTGDTRVNNGATLALGVDHALSANSTLYVDPLGTFDVAGFKQTYDRDLSNITGTVKVGAAGTLTLAYGAAASFVGTLTGPGTLMLNGGGTMSLVGTNNVGSTIVTNSSTYTVNGLQGGVITVYGGSTVNGVSNLGSLYVNGGTYAPGTNGVVATTYMTSLTLTNAGVLDLKLIGAGNDKLFVTNSLSLQGGQLKLNLAAYSYSYGTVIQIVDYNGVSGFDPDNPANWFTLNDLGPNTNQLWANHDVFGVNGGTGSNNYFRINYNDIANGVNTITLTAVPEPGTAALLGLVGAAWLVRRIRRRFTAKG